MEPKGSGWFRYRLPMVPCDQRISHGRSRAKTRSLIGVVAVGIALIGSAPVTAASKAPVASRNSASLASRLVISGPTRITSDPINRIYLRGRFSDGSVVVDRFNGAIKCEGLYCDFGRYVDSKVLDSSGSTSDLDKRLEDRWLSSPNGPVNVVLLPRPACTKSACIMYDGPSRAGPEGVEYDAEHGERTQIQWGETRVDLPGEGQPGGLTGFLADGSLIAIRRRSQVSQESFVTMWKSGTNSIAEFPASAGWRPTRGTFTADRRSAVITSVSAASYELQNIQLFTSTTAQPRELVPSSKLDSFIVGNNLIAWSTLVFTGKTQKRELFVRTFDDVSVGPTRRLLTESVPVGYGGITPVIIFDGRYLVFEHYNPKKENLLQITDVLAPSAKPQTVLRNPSFSLQGIIATNRPGEYVFQTGGTGKYPETDPYVAVVNIALKQ